MHALCRTIGSDASCAALHSAIIHQKTSLRNQFADWCGVNAAAHLWPGAPADVHIITRVRICSPKPLHHESYYLMLAAHIRAFEHMRNVVAYMRYRPEDSFHWHAVCWLCLCPAHIFMHHCLTRHGICTCNIGHKKHTCNQCLQEHEFM